MDTFKPKILALFKKGYSKKQFLQDIKAGFIVAIIALPLSIALAIASGVRPENGLYSAIIGGFMVSLLSGSRIQIGGITAATVMTVCTIIEKYGMTGLAVASVMAGIFLIIMGLLKFGSLLRFIPITITTGFTTGIAIGIFTSQIKEFFGLTVEKMPIRILSKWGACLSAYKTVTWTAVAVGVVSILILVIMPKITEKIPNTLVMIVVMTVAVNVLNIPVNTVKSVYGELPAHFPALTIPQFSFDMIQELMAPSLTLAILVAIVSLLSCVVTDGMIGEKHASNTELVAEGVANIFCGFFGAVPVAGAVARSSNSVKNGGRTPVAGLVHSVIVLVMLLVLMPLVGYIPMPSLSALLMVVAYNMINWHEIFYTIKHAPKSDAAVLIATIAMAVFVDLMAAVEIGLLLASVLFMKRMADVTEVQSWTYIDENDDSVDADNINLKVVPKNTFVFEINGPMFFGAADKVMRMVIDTSNDVLIIRMRGVPAMDATALRSLRQVHEQCVKNNIRLIFSHVNEQPMKMMEKAGFVQEMGEENFCACIDDALELAEKTVNALHKK